MSALDDTLIAEASWGHTLDALSAIERGAHVNARSQSQSDGNTALIVAADNGHIETCIALYLAGADVNLAGKTAAPIWYGAAYKDHQQTAAFIAMGASLDPLSLDQVNATKKMKQACALPRLKAAIFSGSVDLVVHLLQDKSLHPQDDADWKSTIEFAVRRRDARIVSALRSTRAQCAAQEAIDSLGAAKFTPAL